MAVLCGWGRSGRIAAAAAAPTGAAAASWAAPPPSAADVSPLVTRSTFSAPCAWPAGAVPLAKAQADSILQKNPTHLLGLILAARVAALNNDKAGLLAIEKRLVAAEKTELAKKLDEYDRHQDDIANGIAQARSDVGAKR